MDLHVQPEGAQGILLQCLHICGVTAAASPFEGPAGGDHTAVWTLWAVARYFPDGRNAYLLLAGPVQNVDPEVLSFLGMQSRILAAIDATPYAGGWHRFEVAWGVTQWSNPGGPGNYLANGWVELKIDGAVQSTITGEDRIHARPYQGPGRIVLVEDKWNSIRFSGGLAIDNLYMTDVADYGVSDVYWEDDCESGNFLDNNIYFNNGLTNFYDPNNELNNNTRYADYVEGVGNPGRGIASPGYSSFAGFVLATWMFVGNDPPYTTTFAPRANGTARTAICGFVALQPPPTPNDRRLEVSWVAFDVPDDGDDDGEGDDFPGEGCPEGDPAPSVPDDCEGTGPLQID